MTQKKLTLLSGLQNKRTWSILNANMLIFQSVATPALKNPKERGGGGGG